MTALKCTGHSPLEQEGATRLQPPPPEEVLVATMEFPSSTRAHKAPEMELPVAESFTGMAKLKEPYPLTMVGKRGRTRAKTRIVVLILGFLPDFLDKGRMVFFYIIPLSSRTKTAGTSYMKRAAYGLTNFGVAKIICGSKKKKKKTLEKSCVDT